MLMTRSPVKYKFLEVLLWVNHNELRAQIRTKNTIKGRFQKNNQFVTIGGGGVRGGVLSPSDIKSF